MKKKKLLLINQSGRGGLRKHLCDLMLSLDYEIFEVWVAYNNDEVDDIFRQTINQLSGKVTPILINTFVRELNLKQDIKTYLKLSKIIKKINPDIVHCHSSKAGVLGRIAAKRRKIKKVFYTPHWYSFLSTEFSPIRRRMFIEIEKILSTHMTTKTFNTSEGEKNSALSYKIDKNNKFEVIYNGLPNINFPNRMDIRKELEISNNVYLFGNTSRLNHQKNPDLFLKIAHEVIKRDKNIHFIWIGNGSLESEIKDKVVNYNICDNFHLIGYKENSEILVSGFDAFLSTSNGESFGYSAVEALRAGVPVLLSNVMGHNEVAIPGLNGELFEVSKQENYYEVIKNFIDETSSFSKETIKNSFETRFSLESMVRKIENEYYN
ncbi:MULTISPECIES: glycosyltransferase [Lactococcus]|uniref:Glycosyltransferase n=1 Tax=Lactococcus lactis TaxID=1358 RepID=A0AAW8UDN3_9LACT|nr:MULTISPECIES: glycosyltransferase [Lactococcus]MDT2882277.1 glycosyltransferase [Lactococcus lactis]MDT2909866.1 glycosyltransferase [Lactococcus lactis]MDT2946732.1 glycosyltransferase [Lactococcus lactis]RDG24122.1 group 1 glycosyltransferase [Lactococcus cremoris]